MSPLTKIAGGASRPVFIIPTAGVIFVVGTLLGIRKVTSNASGVVEEASVLVAESRVEMKNDMDLLKEHSASVDKNMALATSAIEDSNKKFDRLNDNFDKFLLIYAETQAEIRVLQSRVGRNEKDIEGIDDKWEKRWDNPILND